MSGYSYPCELPRDVVSVSIPKVKGHRRNWILLACRDKSFDAAFVVGNGPDSATAYSFHREASYSDFFDIIQSLAPCRGSIWCLTFRSRFALHRAGWIEALRSGKVKLERQLKLAGEQAGAGRVCLSHGFTELDLRLGKRKVKLLDWSNYNVSPEDYGLKTEDLGIDQCIGIFDNWSHAYGSIGLSASRSSSAQIGWARLRQSLKHVVLFTSLDPEMRALERRCCYGGRCEPFRLGEQKGKCYLMDIKACYASVCYNSDLPSQPLRYFPDGCDIELIKQLQHQAWAADCIVKTDRPIFPVRIDNQVIYPTGSFATSLCGKELLTAVETGAVLKVTKAASYVSVGILKEYADWYFGARAALSTGPHKRQLPGLKAAFNSSLGFLARKGREWIDWKPAGSPPWWFGITLDPEDLSSIVSAHTLAGESELLAVGSEPRNCAPIVHASICAAARTILSILIHLAGDGNVLYCDTDGLIVNQAGMDRLKEAEGVVGDNYGQLSERFAADRCIINGQKNYRIGKHVVCAGLQAANHKAWQKSVVLQTTTGVVGDDGIVRPHKVECEDMGGESARYRNFIVCE